MKYDSHYLKKFKNIIKEDLQVGMEKKDDTHPIALLNKYLRESEDGDPIKRKVAKLIERQHMLKRRVSKRIDTSRRNACKAE